MKQTQLFRNSILLLSLALATACGKQDSVAPAEGLHAASVSQDATIGAYTVLFQGLTHANNSTTYSYSIQRTGPARANGLSHWIIALPTGCTQAITYRSVIRATVDRRAYGNLAGSEGNGTGCSTAMGANILKFDNLPSGISDGAVHTFTFTLPGTLSVGNAASWVKFGKRCEEGVVPGPSCQLPTPPPAPTPTPTPGPEAPSA